ncbi:hypothetical protein ACFL2T_00620 [Elusimicrobiota bacterium]
MMKSAATILAVLMGTLALSIGCRGGARPGIRSGNGSSIHQETIDRSAHSTQVADDITIYNFAKAVRDFRSSRISGPVGFREENILIMINGQSLQPGLSQQNVITIPVRKDVAHFALDLSIVNANLGPDASIEKPVLHLTLKDVVFQEAPRAGLFFDFGRSDRIWSRADSPILPTNVDMDDPPMHHMGSILVNKPPEGEYIGRVDLQGLNRPHIFRRFKIVVKYTK